MRLERGQSEQEPSRIRFAAADRHQPKGNPRAGMWLFALTLIILTLSGFRGFALITEFLEVAGKRPVDKRPEPVTVEFR